MCSEKPNTEFIGVVTLDYTNEFLQKHKEEILKSTRESRKNPSRVKTVYFDGLPLRIRKMSLKSFLKGFECSCCGAKPLYFCIEKHTDSKHVHFLTLYVERPDGYIDRMTADHIIPKSKGGSDDLDNLQPMCYTCNTTKGDKI